MLISKFVKEERKFANFTQPELAQKAEVYHLGLYSVSEFNENIFELYTATLYSSNLR